MHPSPNPPLININIHIIGNAPVVDENVCLALDWGATTLDSKVISKDLVRLIFFAATA
jgi:hypothetical protein